MGRRRGETLRWLRDAVASRDRIVCWPWPFALSDRGYPMVYFDGRVRNAAGVALIMDGSAQPSYRHEVCRGLPRLRRSPPLGHALPDPPLIRAADLRPGDIVELDLHLGPARCQVDSVHPLEGGRLLVCYRRERGPDLRLSADPDDVLTLIRPGDRTHVPRETDPGGKPPGAVVR